MQMLKPPASEFTLYINSIKPAGIVPPTTRNTDSCNNNASFLQQQEAQIAAAAATTTTMAASGHSRNATGVAPCPLYYRCCCRTPGRGAQP